MKKSELKVAFIGLALLAFFSNTANAWGFWAHQRINRVAVFLLPVEMIGFYKQNIDFITDHAVDPDKRRYAIPEEAPRHYIDLDHYCAYPCADFPRKWDSAVAKFGADTLNAYGIGPWHLQRVMYELTEAFRQKSKNRILRLSADIGHYAADANVPLHTSENYNGQFTDQLGIHAFWESRIPELFGEDYDYFVGNADYIRKPLDRIWKTVLESHHALDSVLGFEKTLSRNFPADKMYAYDSRNSIMTRLYSEDYSAAYSKMMDGMVERKMRSSIQLVADIWYTCWVNAGSPNLDNLEDKPLSAEEKTEQERIEETWQRNGRQEGKHHW